MAGVRVTGGPGFPGDDDDDFLILLIIELIKALWKMFWGIN